MTGSIEKIIEFVGANLGAGGTIAAAGMLLALPMGLLDSVKEKIREQIREYIARLNLSDSDPVTTEEARGMIRRSLRVVFLDIVTILLFIAGVALARSLSRGTPWERGPDFSDFHVMLLGVFAAAWFFHSSRSLRNKIPAFDPRNQAGAGEKKRTVNRRDVFFAVTTFLLVAISEYYIPLFFSAYIAGNGALQILFPAGKNGKGKENAA